LAALLAGHTDSKALADMAKGRLRSTRDQRASALDSRVTPHHRFVLTELLSQIDSFDETIARFDAQIQAIGGPVEDAVGLLDTIPDVARHTAEMIVAESGIDMTRFPNADPLALGAGVALGTHESAGNRTSGKTLEGDRFLRTTLVQAAHIAARTQGTYLNAPYRRLATRRGKKREFWRWHTRSWSWPILGSNGWSPTAKPGPTFSTGCSPKTPLGASSNAWKASAIM
jgi:transposase